MNTKIIDSQTNFGVGVDSNIVIIIVLVLGLKEYKTIKLMLTL